MDHDSATHPDLRRNLRIILARYRHLPQMPAAIAALDELETAFALLQQSAPHLPEGCPEASRIRTFLAGRIVSSEGER